MAEWKSGQVILGEYLIEKELGKGGMGRVWLVKSNSTGRQFAIKQTILKDDKSRKAFLAELQAWIDLPEHPNIVPCRFFRTVGEEIVIFTDYAEGGSLADWVAKGKLTSLEQIINVAIQFAWGLHAIHERGLIHQDIKPSNVLMTAEGVPMVADFGLARARQVAPDGQFASPNLPVGQQSVVVSYGGMTPAYASPEQSAGQPLSRKTDIWSWGVSVLDMFIGEPSCSAFGGRSASAVLEQFMENGGQEEGLPKMPQEVANVLRKCFVTTPNIRPSAIEIINNIECVLPDSQRKAAAANKIVANIRNENSGEQLVDYGGDVVRWLEMAYRAAQKDPSIAIKRYEESCSGGARAYSVRQFAALDEAIKVLNESKVHSASDIQCHQALILKSKANILFNLNDISGAYALLNDSINKMEHLLVRENTGYIAIALAEIYIAKGSYVIAAGKPADAIAPHERALKILNELNCPTTVSQIEVIKAQAWGGMGAALHMLGHHREAIRALKTSISICQSIDALSIYSENIKQVMALAYLNTGLTLSDMGDYIESMRMLKSSEELLLSFGDKSEWQDARSNLAHCYMNQGRTLDKMCNYPESIKYYKKSISLYREIAGPNKRHPVLYMLAIAVNNKAVVDGKCERYNEANCGYDEAISILRKCIEVEGRSELRLFLAQALALKARLCNAQGDVQVAHPINREVMNIYCKLIKEDNRDDLWGDYMVHVLSAYFNFRYNGQWTPAMTNTIREAFQILQREIQKTKRQDLANQLEIAFDMYGDLLG